jgi:hypothetical protein
MNRIAVAVLCLALGGCGVAARIEAQSDYRTSAAQYKACLAANPAAPANCESLRLVMETDERRFTNTGAALGGSQTSHNVTILNR